MHQGGVKAVDGGGRSAYRSVVEALLPVVWLSAAVGGAVWIDARRSKRALEILHRWAADRGERPGATSSSTSD